MVGLEDSAHPTRQPLTPLPRGGERETSRPPLPVSRLFHCDRHQTGYNPTTLTERAAGPPRPPQAARSRSAKRSRSRRRPGDLRSCYGYSRPIPARGSAPSRVRDRSLVHARRRAGRGHVRRHSNGLRPAPGVLGHHRRARGRPGCSSPATGTPSSSSAGRCTSALSTWPPAGRWTCASRRGRRSTSGQVAPCLYHVEGNGLRWCPGRIGSGRRLSAFPSVDDPKYLCADVPPRPAALGSPARATERAPTFGSTSGVRGEP